MLKDPIQWARVRRRVLSDGESIRGVAKAEGLSRNMTRKVLRLELPPRYSRAKKPTLLTDYGASINKILAEDERRPQRERRSITAIYQLLKEQHGYSGSYASVARYCSDERTHRIDLVVQPIGADTSINDLSIVRTPRVYHLNPHQTKGESGITRRLRRDARAERAAEVASWIDRLRGDRLEFPPRGDPDATLRLLRAVHDRQSRQRNRAVTVLAYEQGFPVKRITACLSISRNTCRRYVRLYKGGGVEKLLAPMVRGIKKADDEDLKAAVFRTLHGPPKDYGIN